MSSYQPGIPSGTIDLDVDYLNIQGNFQQLDTSFAVDHVTFSNQTPQNGYHQSIRFNPVSTTVTNAPNNQPVVSPATVANYGQLFSAQINDGINTDTAFYFKTGGGRLTQLSRNFQPVAATRGYTFLPGGLILQWGTDLSTGKDTAIVFPQPLSATAYSVTVGRGQTSTITDGYGVTLVTSTGFTFTSTSALAGVRLFWMAIGI